ncbi:hypothetical protein EU528_07590, partial [Candidatus Thorarchaeota archaeon]
PWFTCHPATYTKQAVKAIAQYADVIGFWVTDEDGKEGWQTNHPGYQLALRICNEIHLMDWNTIHGTTEWFECGFGNDSVTDSVDNWYTSYWHTIAPDASLSIGLTSDNAIGSSAINLTCTTAGTHSYWWQKLGHDYGFQDQMGFPYASINMTDASRITFWVKGIGWDNHPEADVTMYIEKSNYPIGFAGNLTLPDFTLLLSDGSWHQVQVALPLDSSAYCDWDGYASQIHIVVDYLTDVSGDTTTILFDGFIVESFDTGKSKGLATTSDYVWVENGTLEVAGDAFFESNLSQTDSWFYRYSGTGTVEMNINGNWTTPPDQGIPCYWNVSGYRLYEGTYDWIEFHCIPPFVEIDNPLEGDKLSGIVDVQVSATDDEGIDEVKFYVDGVLKHTDDTFPFSWSWDTQTSSDGTHGLNVTALSLDANLNYHHIEVIVDNTDPVVSVSNPINESIVTDTQSIEVTASDSSGIDRVEFYLDGVLYFTDFSSPYSYSWDTTLDSDGWKNLTALATDDAGNTNSDTILVTVDNSAPLLTIHSLSVWGDSGQVSANTSDASGIDRVEFYLDGALQETDYSYPYQWVWSGLLFPDGDYMISIVSYDIFDHNSSASSGFEIDNTLPSLSVSWTPPGTYLSDVVSFTATATDSNGVAYVEFYLDGVLQVTDYSAPYSWIWDTTLVADGNHTIEVIAVDNMANAHSRVIRLDVDNTSPIIFVNTPANETILAGPCTVWVQVSILDTSSIDTVLLSYNTSVSWISIEMIPSGSYFEATIPLLPQGSVVLFRIYANDTLGNSAYSEQYLCSIVDLNPPSVDIDFTPSALTVAGTVQIDVSVTDESSISLVIIYIDGSPMAWLSSSPYSWSWDTSVLGDGSHTVIAWANDTMNNSGFSEATVTTDNTGPSVVINGPLGGMIFSGPYSISVLATAIDTVGIDVVLLSYNIGPGWINISMMISGNQYEGTIPTLQPGDIVDVRIVANDTLGNTAWSGTSSFTIIDDTNPSLSVDLTPASSPISNNLYIEAAVSDLSGISMVIFYVDGVPLSTDTVAPYEYLLDTTGFLDGSHTIRVWVNDTWDNSHYEEVAITTDNTGPLIVLNSPLNASTFEGPCSISVLVTTLDATAIDSVLFRYNSGSGWTITTMSPNGNRYEGIILGLLPGDVIEVQIYANDTLGNEEWSTTYVYYVVDETPPSLMVDLTPDAPIYGGILHIGVTASDISGISMVVFYIDDIPIATDSSAPFEHLLDTSSLLDGIHTLRVWVNDTWDNSDFEELVLETDNSNPEIIVNSPSNGTVYDAPIRISVESSVGDANDLSHVLVFYTIGSVWISEPMVLSGSIYIWNSSLLSSGTVLQFYVFANDTIGNEALSSLYESQVYDLSGPHIQTPTRLPIVPTSFDSVIISSSITDHSGVDTAILSYRVNSGSWTNITMSLSSSYWASIPALATGTTVNYRIYASDTLNQWALTPIYEYTVVPFDVLPPKVFDINWAPLIPDTSQGITVFVNATDQSGVVDVILSYHDGTNLHNITMVFSGGLYTAQIPPQSYQAYITMKVYSSDGQENWGITPIGSFTVISDDLVGPMIDAPILKPSIPTEEDEVEVYVEILDDNEIQTAILNYGHGSLFVNVTMIYNGTGYVATIGANPIGTHVQFRVYSCDNRDNWAVGDWYVYIVVASDVTAPVISDVEWLPVSPVTTESIYVNATITDENLLSQVLLGYYDGVLWRNLTMVQMPNDRFIVQIPAIGVAGTIQIQILAQDVKGNWGITDHMDIDVQLESITTTTTTTTTTTSPTNTTSTGGTSLPDSTLILVFGGSGWALAIVILVYSIRKKK